MKLTIKNLDLPLRHRFCEHFLPVLKQRLIESIDISKLSSWDKYLATLDGIRSLYRKHISSLDILHAGIQNIIYSYKDTSITFEINPSVLTPGLDRVKLNTLCRLINFGNLQIPGYPLFTTVFTEISNDIGYYIDRYAFDVL